jgi:hypothetical protein
VRRELRSNTRHTLTRLSHYVTHVVGNASGYGVRRVLRSERHSHYVTHVVGNASGYGVHRVLRSERLST